MILYKYTDNDTAFQILTNKKFRYTQPIAFNDPFEVSPVSEQEIGTEFLTKHINLLLSTSPNREIVYTAAFKNMYDKLPEGEKKSESFIEFQDKLILDIEIELKRMGKSINEIILEKFQSIKQQYTEYFFRMLPIHIGQSTGVLCLSSKSDNLLMWSHYADSHLGLVLEIDIDNSFFTNIRDVKYTINRPLIDINYEYDNEQEKIKYAEAIFFTKSEDWIYESEFRDLKLLFKDKSTNKKDRLGFPIVLFEFPIDIIKGIIFGSRQSTSVKKEFIEMTNSLGYQIEYKEALLDNKLFRVNIENYNSNRTLFNF